MGGWKVQSGAEPVHPPLNLNGYPEVLAGSVGTRVTGDIEFVGGGVLGWG